MANAKKLNKVTKSKQHLTLAIGVVIFFATWMIIVFASRYSSKPHVQSETSFSSVMDSQFSEADTESAMTSQQLELESIKTNIKALRESVKAIEKSTQVQTSLVTEQLAAEIAKVKVEVEKKSSNTNDKLVLAQNETFFPNNTMSDARSLNSIKPSKYLNKSGVIHSVSYNYASPKKHFKKTPETYVPSNTFAKAILLGGADADASVTAPNSNNSVMLLKILSRGTLPNGQKSYLNGCFLHASSYGDISTERAFARLQKISCAHKGHPIIDKTVSGWVFFGGKVGIKGKPIIRDGKIVQWAGISGALAGVAQAAQYAQTAQNFGGYGIASAVPSSKIAPYVGYGGASKAAEQLSSYYIKRAEQYHPAIQVGAGNLVNIVFEEGFYLNDEEDRQELSQKAEKSNEPTIPKEVIAQINQAHLGQTINQSGE